MSDRELIDNTIKERYDQDAVRKLSITLAEDQFGVGTVYYAEFESKDEDGEWNDDFFYALVSRDRITLYDDGIEVIRGLNTLLQRRKTFWQRFTEFSLVDIVGAVIAMSITVTFIAATLSAYYGGGKLDDHLVSIFTVIVGYYFGRVSSAFGVKT
jgi:hypothetical protein